jgi:hypothetical protein
MKKAELTEEELPTKLEVLLKEEAPELRAKADPTNASTIENLALEEGKIDLTSILHEDTGGSYFNATYESIIVFMY